MDKIRNVLHIVRLQSVNETVLNCHGINAYAWKACLLFTTYSQIKTVAMTTLLDCITDEVH
jgi:hypothetical protein